MRLSNVTHLRLPFGRLFGFDIGVATVGAEQPVSFDQGRHVGAGERPGSWMALSFTLPAPVDRELMSEAWLAVVRRHGTLTSVFTPGADGPELHQVALAPLGWVEHPIAPGQAVNDALRQVLDARCTPYARPSHRLCVLETAAGPCVVIAADHSHVDMWSMLVIVRDFLAALDSAKRGEEIDLPPALDFAQHTRELASRPSAPSDVRERWAEILEASGGVMPRFPLPLGDPAQGPERVEVRDVLDVNDAAAFSAQARADGVSTLALAVAAMTHVTRKLAGTPLRAVFPVHSRYDATWHDCVGWFITNSVIESADSDPAVAAAAVKEAIRLGSYSLADILAPWGGMREAPGMFAISWLDLRRLPVRVDSVSLRAEYVSASIQTNGVMIWFSMDETGLHLRCRYPDTPEARTNVGHWLDELVAHMCAVARASTSRTFSVDGETYRVERAERSDVPAVVGLINEDELGRPREGAELARYEAAYDVVSRDPSQYLAIVRNPAGTIVGTMQLSVIPGLIRSGATRLQIEGLRVAAPNRGRGIGTAMMDWAHRRGRIHAATLAQVTTDADRDRARAFYTRLGYETNHVGLKKEL